MGPSASWFAANLPDPTLAKEARALWDAGHSLSRADVITLFETAAAEGPTVTASELTALQTLANDGKELGMTDAVQNLASKAVNYSMANLQYQGQTLLPTGQLAAGDPSTDLHELIEKWFLGTDTPQLIQAGQTNYTGEDLASGYQQAAGTLYQNNRPSYRDICQDYIGDCYFMSSLGATVHARAAAIKDMITDNHDGTFTVRFFEPQGSGYVADYVTVNGKLPTDSEGYFVYANGGPPNPTTVTNLAGDPNNILWVPLLEKAYAQWSAEFSQQGYAAGTNSYNTIGHGGYPSDALPAVLGQAATDGGFTSASEQVVAQAVKAHEAVVLTSYDTQGDKSHVVGDHVYYVIGYSAKTHRFTVVNPWGYNYSDPPIQGTLHLTWAQIGQHYVAWTVAPL